MNTIQLENVDLTSMMRAAAKNGAPSTQDYNETVRDFLADLSNIVDFLNQCITPVLNALPSVAAKGLTGAAVYASVDSTDPVFFNKTKNVPFTVTEVLQNAYGLVNVVNNRVTDLSGKVAKLQTLLSTTGHTDILSSVQSISDQIRNLGSSLNTMRQTMGQYDQRFQATKTLRIDIDPVTAQGFVQQDVFWEMPFASDDYTVTLSVEDSTGNLVLNGWSKITGGKGIHVRVFNNSQVVTGGILHMIGQLNAGAA